MTFILKVYLLMWAFTLPPEPVVEPAPTVVAAVVEGVHGCPAVIITLFGDDSRGCAVAFCESRWQAWVVNSGGYRGLFQIGPQWHQGKLERLFAEGLVENMDYLDPATNARLAYDISNGGHDWSAWRASQHCWG